MSTRREEYAASNSITNAATLMTTREVALRFCREMFVSPPMMVPRHPGWGPITVRVRRGRGRFAETFRVAEKALLYERAGGRGRRRKRRACAVGSRSAKYPY